MLKPNHLSCIQVSGNLLRRFGMQILNPSLDGVRRVSLGKYEKILKDPSNWSMVFDNIKRSLESDRTTLRELKLSEDRWGSIKKVMDGVENGELNADVLTSRVLESVGRMKKGCASGSIDESPCRERFGDQQTMLRWLTGTGSGHTSACAQTDFRRFFGEPP